MGGSIISQDTDLASLFGFDLEQAEADGSLTELPPILCAKCDGKGRVIGWSGRDIGPCRACAGLGVPRALTTAKGLCKGCGGSGKWSPDRQCFRCQGTGKETADTSREVDVSAIATSFAAARANHIQRPKLRLGNVVFSLAPDHGKNAGAIYVKTGEVYLGKIADGRFHPVRDCDATLAAHVIEVASDPHRAAKAYGQHTGKCSCCGRPLTNGESIDLGIGPICRDKYGWA